MNPAVAALTLCAIAVTKTVDFVRNVVDQEVKAPKWVWNALAVALGLIVSLVWELNAFEAISHTPAQGVTGQAFTGIAIGAAASGYHELFDALGSSAKARKPRG